MKPLIGNHGVLLRPNRATYPDTQGKIVSDVPSSGEIDDFKEFDDHSSDRGLAISLGNIVDNRLTSILTAVMRPDKKLLNELFQPSGPLGNLRTKIRLGYMLRIYSKKFYEDLSTIARIRNLFAHRVDIKEFEQHPVSAWVKGMRVYPILISLRDKPANDEFAQILSHTLELQLSTMRGSFRECVRLIISLLNEMEKKMLASRRAAAEAAEALKRGSAPGAT